MFLDAPEMGREQKKRRRGKETSMIKDLKWEPLASCRKQSRLCTMYKISNDIIHVNKSKYLTPATELVDPMILNIKSLNIFKNKLSDYLRGD